MDWASAAATALFRVCADSRDPQPWDEFVRRYGTLISRTAFRAASRWTRPTEDLLDDLVQEVYVKLCDNRGRALKNFEDRGAGSEFGFLKVFTVNAVSDYFRSRKWRRAGGEESVPLDSVPEPARNGEALQELRVREIEDALERVAQGPTAERDRAVFLLYYRQGFTASAISQLPTVGLTCEGVESLLNRLSKAVREHLAGGATQPAKGRPA